MCQSAPTCCGRVGASPTIQLPFADMASAVPPVVLSPSPLRYMGVEYGGTSAAAVDRFPAVQVSMTMRPKSSTSIARWQPPGSALGPVHVPSESRCQYTAPLYPPTTIVPALLMPSAPVRLGPRMRGVQPPDALGSHTTARRSLKRPPAGC